MMKETNDVLVWEEQVMIPTYEIGAAEKNPIFSEKRVYQGSSGKVYPYPVVEKISDEKVDKQYKAVYLENQYIKVMILPELGGRIQRAYDKTNDYDFVYYNHVIKPALVGLTGPWISGGIEFNWPQHHRPTTFSPIDYLLQENDDGSKTVLVHDVDQMYGTTGIAAFTLYPDKAFIEIGGQLYNRTPFPQTFLWWANPAIAVNDYTQSIFPPDVHAVMDHGKRDVSKFPIATGVYYKHDYSGGVDISRYKNIPVPTSYMAEKSDFDFVGGYDYNLRAGILHVADHHISPGKKQWTWGCGEFGQAWDRNLTDEDGPYIELMTGVYTDNQPDFTWLKPFEEKTFKQYFMPYKAVGEVKNATIDAAINFLPKKDESYLCIYATATYQDAQIIIEEKGKTIFTDWADISPVDIYEQKIALDYEVETDLTAKVIDRDGNLLVAFTPLKKEIQTTPSPAEASKEPQEIMTNEELFLTGLHIEQYRHATYEPDAYYLEGLKRDPNDIRINNAYGRLLMKQGAFNEAEVYLRRAIERLTWKNPNPYDSEAYYNLGLTLFYQGRADEAYDAFFKATWTNEQQEMSFYYLAALDTQKGDYLHALEMIDKSLVKNSHHVKARGLKAVILRKLGKSADDWIKENLKVDPFDFISAFENTLNYPNEQRVLENWELLLRGFHENYLQTARDYGEWGCFAEAIEVLRCCPQKQPMLKYYEAYYGNQLGEKEEAKVILKEAERCDTDYCFPNKMEDILVLENAINHNPNGAKAPYYLGTLYYDKKQYSKSKQLWELSVALDDTNPTALRNLAMAYYNKCDLKQEARELLEKAFALNTADSRIFMELDQLGKKLLLSPQERIQNCEKYQETAMDRDDMFIEYITLLNQTGQHEKAYQLLLSRKLHPWEGGEGKATTQYKTALVELAKQKIKQDDYKAALKNLHEALIYPENLGEGKLEGTKDNDIYYYLGDVYEALSESEKAKEYFEKASIGTAEPAGMMYYNDQPADMILYQGLAKKRLRADKEAKARFNKLIDYGERHIYDDVRIEYFAVSLPDFMIFNEDWNKRNKVHCCFLMGLGHLGNGDREKANEYFEEALELDQNHLKCILLLKN